MPEIALQEKREKDADCFADVYEALTRRSCLPEWMRYNAHLHDVEDHGEIVPELLSHARGEEKAVDHKDEEDSAYHIDHPELDGRLLPHGQGHHGQGKAGHTDRVHAGPRRGSVHAAPPGRNAPASRAVRERAGS